MELYPAEVTHFEHDFIEFEDEKVPVSDLKYYEGTLVDERDSHVKGAIIDGIFIGEVNSKKDGIYYIESAKRHENIKDAQTNSLYTINDALSNGLLDKSTFSYQNLNTGQSISLNEAYEQGFVNGQFYYSEKSKDVIESGEKRNLFEDISYQIKYIIDPDTNTK